MDSGETFLVRYVYISVIFHKKHIGKVAAFVLSAIDFFRFCVIIVRTVN